jgi:hypothetical protein
MGFLRCARSGDVPRFLDAVDYWFGYSDTSSTEGYDPARERFTVGIGDVVGGMNAMGPAMDKIPGLGDEPIYP